MNEFLKDLQHRFWMAPLQRLLGQHMQPSVTEIAQCHQVLLRVVALIVRNALAHAVDVMHMKNFGRSAPDALFAVAFKRFPHRAFGPEAMMGAPGQLACSLWIALLPATSCLHVAFRLAGLASFHRAVAKDEPLAAVDAMKRHTSGARSALGSGLRSVRELVALVDGWNASGATALGARGWREPRKAFGAISFFVYPRCHRQHYIAGAA